MTVSSASEFEAVVSRIRIRVGKRVDKVPDPTNLKTARRQLDELEEAARDAGALKKLRPKLTEAAKLLRKEMPHDTETSHMLWDLMDYIDYRC
jgi:hypothetical protein